MSLRSLFRWPVDNEESAAHYPLAFFQKFSALWTCDTNGSACGLLFYVTDDLIRLEDDGGLTEKRRQFSRHTQTRTHPALLLPLERHTHDSGQRDGRPHTPPDRVAPFAQLCPSVSLCLCLSLSLEVLVVRKLLTRMVVSLCVYVFSRMSSMRRCVVQLLAAARLSSRYGK